MAIRSFVYHVCDTNEIRTWKMNRALCVSVCTVQWKSIQIEMTESARTAHSHKSFSICCFVFSIFFFFYLVRCWWWCWQHCRWHIHRCRIAAACNVIVRITTTTATIVIRWFFLFSRFSFGFAAATTLSWIGRWRLWWVHWITATINSAHTKSTGKCGCQVWMWESLQTGRLKTREIILCGQLSHWPPAWKLR